MSKTTPKETSSVTSIDDVEDTALTKAESDPVKDLAVTDTHGAFQGEKVKLIINSEPGDVGQQAVYVGINGHGFNIPRDIEVIVPIEVIDQLDNAKMVNYESIEGGKTREREVKRFSYSVRPLPAAK